MRDPLLNRRQLLRGLGGLSLALPLLPSLLPRRAFADELTDNAPRFVAMATHHGGIWSSNMYPAFETLTRSQTYAGHTIRAGDLRRRVEGERALLSPVLSAPASRLTESIVAQMNVVRGLDIPFYIAHHSGGYLGNYARNDGNGGDGQTVQAFPWPTIDQVMAWSPSFYPSLDGVPLRAMVLGEGRMSYNYANPANRSGEIQQINPEHSSLALFNTIFQPNQAPERQRTPIADRVLENYQRLRQSDRRLSAADRQRLDDHIERIHELQRRLNATASCEDVPVPTGDSRVVRNTSGYSFTPQRMTEYWQLTNEVIAAAFACGACCVAVMHCGDTFSTFQGDWHQDVAHQAEQTDGQAQQTIATAHQRFFESVFLDLATKLQITQSGGTSLLDQSLVMWVQESGNVTHNSYSLPVVTAGGAAGYFRTGQYVDYRNLDRGDNLTMVPETGKTPGLIYNQWLANVLMAMGLSPAEYERANNPGYGHMFIGQHGWYQQPDFYPTSVQQVVGQRLPLITTAA